MKTPFTADQFLGVFREYNLGVFPMQIIFYLLGIVVVYLAVKPNALSDKIISSILAFFWLWMGIVYHILYFAEINKAAYLFGIAFIVQGILYVVFGVFQDKLSVSSLRNYRSLPGCLRAIHLPNFGVFFGPRLSRFAHIWPSLPNHHFYIWLTYAFSQTSFMHTKEIKQLLSDEDAHLDKLHKIVKETLEAEELIVHNLVNPPMEVLTQGQKLSDKVAQFGGSWRFIRLFGLVLTVWIIFNVLAVGVYKFDPYPFILMNLILSCIAALQAPIIMMSQNRQEEKDRMRSENDYMINLKAEMQIRSINQKIDLLLEEQIKTLFETQEKQFILLQEINRKLKIQSAKP